jgi:hypothetical protein
VLPEYQKTGYLRYLASVLDDNVCYELAIGNINVIAQKIALSVGFVPMGSILQDDKLFIQYKREKNG